MVYTIYLNVNFDVNFDVKMCMMCIYIYTHCILYAYVNDDQTITIYEVM